MMKRTIQYQHNIYFLMPCALFFCSLVTFEIATMPGLELVDVLVQLVPSFQVFLRGHRWENTHGSNSAKVVVKGEM